MQKRVLIICYYWPPSGGSGVQRWLKFVKYLPEFGWQPVIYTPLNPDFNTRDEGLLEDIPKNAEVIKRRIWEPYSLGKILTGNKNLNKGIIDKSNARGFVKKSMNWIRGNVFIPDPRIFWVNPSVRFLKKYLQINPVDLIVSTGPPHSMHLIAKKIKSLTGIPWIADFRDPWSQLDFLDSFQVTDRNRKKYEKMERDVLKACDLVLATSPSMPECLLPFDKSKFRCITHGYDEDDFKYHNNNKERTGKITLYHAGLLNRLRNPLNLWEGLNNLCAANADIKERLVIHLAGTIDPGVIQDIHRFEHLKNKLVIEAYKPHGEVIKDYLNADVLLLLVNNSSNSKVNIPGKLFEYLATSHNILMIGNKEADAAKIIHENQAGLVFDYEETIGEEDLEHIILSGSTGQGRERSKFSRRSLSRELSDLFAGLIRENK